MTSQLITARERPQASTSTRDALFFVSVVVLFLRFRRARLVLLVLVVATEAVVALVIDEAAVISLAMLVGVYSDE